MAIFAGQSWHVFKSWYTGGLQNKDFCVVSQTDFVPEGYYLTCKDLVFISPSFFFRKYAEAKACVKNATLTLCKMTEEQVEVVNFYCDTFNPFCFNLSDPPMV